MPPGCGGVYSLKLFFKNRLYFLLVLASHRSISAAFTSFNVIQNIVVQLATCVTREWLEEWDSSGLQCAPPSSPLCFLLLLSGRSRKTSRQSEESRRRRSTAAKMAADRSGSALEEDQILNSSDPNFSPDHGCQLPKRHARVTVKYNRRELQKRLDVEKWIDEGLDQLYLGQVGPTGLWPLQTCVTGKEELFFFKSKLENVHIKSSHWAVKSC